MIKVVQALPDHIQPIADNMRSADRHEIWASSRVKPREALFMSLSGSEFCWSIIKEDKPVAMFGAARRNLLSSTGIPWMLGTPEIDDIKSFVLRRSKKYIREMADAFDYLENYVHGENKVSINWLAWCGFYIDEGKPYGPDKEIFHRFWMKNERTVSNV